jgi:hypothetical protein
MSYAKTLFYAVKSSKECMNIFANNGVVLMATRCAGRHQHTPGAQRLPRWQMVERRTRDKRL